MTMLLALSCPARAPAPYVGRCGGGAWRSPQGAARAERRPTTPPHPPHPVRRRRARPGTGSTARTAAAGGLFDNSIVHDIAVTYDEAAYDAMIAAFVSTGDKDWITATVTIDGTTFRDVGHPPQGQLVAHGPAQRERQRRRARRGGRTGRRRVGRDPERPAVADPARQVRRRRELQGHHRAGGALATTRRRRSTRPSRSSCSGSAGRPRSRRSPRASA